MKEKTKKKIWKIFVAIVIGFMIIWMVAPGLSGVFF